MHDQADELRQLVRESLLGDCPASAAPRLLVVHGGKGGVGTTTVAVNLALAMGKSGSRAILIDADLARGDVAAHCQLSGSGSLDDVLSGRHSIHEVLQRGPLGLQILPGRGADALMEYHQAAHERLLTELGRLHRHADILVLDAGSGRTPFVRRCWQAADAVLLVTTPETAVIMESYSAIKVLAADHAERVNLLVNFSRSEEAATEVHARIDQACRRFLGSDTQFAGSLPGDPHVPAAIACGVPLLVRTPDSPAAAAVDLLAMRMLQNIPARELRQHRAASRQQVA